METSEEQAYVAEFESLLEGVRCQLLDAQTHFDILKALMFPTEKEIERVLDRYQGFFLPTALAHSDRWVIKISNATDANGPMAPSLYRVLNMAGRHQDLAPGVDTRVLRQRLKKHGDVLRRIWEVRKKRAAHSDTDVRNPLENMSPDEITGLLTELEGIFNEIHQAHHRNKWSFQRSEHDHVLYVLMRLAEAARPSS